MWFCDSVIRLHHSLPHWLQSMWKVLQTLHHLSRALLSFLQLCCLANHTSLCVSVSSVTSPATQGYLLSQTLSCLIAFKFPSLTQPPLTITAKVLKSFFHPLCFHFIYWHTSFYLIFYTSRDLPLLSFWLDCKLLRGKSWWVLFTQCWTLEVLSKSQWNEWSKGMFLLINGSVLTGKRS